MWIPRKTNASTAMSTDGNRWEIGNFTNGAIRAYRCFLMRVFISTVSQGVMMKRELRMKHNKIDLLGEARSFFYLAAFIFLVLMVSVDWAY